jgi:hypothetical protein
MVAEKCVQCSSLKLFQRQLNRIIVAFFSFDSAPSPHPIQMRD